MFARDGRKPLSAHILFVLFSPLHSWKARELHRKALVTLNYALLRLANKWGRLALLPLGKAQSLFLTGVHGGKK